MSLSVLVTDTKYRSSLSAVQALGECGYSLFCVQTERELAGRPAAFSSKYAERTVILPGSCRDEDYLQKLQELCEEITREKKSRPVIFPVGAITLAQLAGAKERLSQSADFLVSSPEILDRANDKRQVARLALSLGIPVPEEYSCSQSAPPPGFPVVIKPRCGEKLGLHAEERYCKVYRPEEYSAAYEKMAQYDSQPVVQELLTGDGIGVSVVMDKDVRPVSILCHRRIREYPIEGGPSACCESLWDDRLVDFAVKLLTALGFVGIAMVEFKGGKLLEINPRIWGSVPLTYKAQSPFADCYVRAACGETLPLCTRPQYKLGVRVRFTLNDGLACLSYLRNGQRRRGLSGLLDIFRPGCKEALFSIKDPKPFFTYLRTTLRKGGT